MRTNMLLIIVLCIIAGAAHATPSTLVWIPSTDIQAAKVSHLGYDIYAPSSGSTLTDLGLTFGTGKVEYGVDYLSMDGIQDPVRLNAKVMLKDETPTMPRLVAGTFDTGGDAASSMVYLLGSKTFSGTRVHLGYCAGKSSVLGSDNKMILAGVDRAFDSKWWGGVDYQSGRSSFGALNVGISYNFTPTRSLILGYDWYNDSSLSDTLTMQLDVNY